MPVIPYVFHEDVFFEYFEPYRHPEVNFDDIWDGIGLETFGADIEIVRQLAREYVWTVVDADCGNDQWITPSVRYVNRSCYLVSRKPNHRIDIDFRVRHSYSSLTPLGLRRQVSKLIQSAALVLEADFVFAIMEAWSLRPDKMPQMDAILDKYGSIGASPYAVDVCSFTLETRRGVWVAQTPIKPKGISKKKRTIGKVEFRYYTEVQGRFTHLLPVKEGAEPPTILH